MDDRSARRPRFDVIDVAEPSVNSEKPAVRHAWTFAPSARPCSATSCESSRRSADCRARVKSDPYVGACFRRRSSAIAQVGLRTLCLPSRSACARWNCTAHRNRSHQNRDYQLQCSTTAGRPRVDRLQRRAPLRCDDRCRDESRPTSRILPLSAGRRNGDTAPVLRGRRPDGLLDRTAMEMAGVAHARRPRQAPECTRHNGDAEPGSTPCAPTSDPRAR